MRPPRTGFKRNDRFGEYLLVDYLGGGGSGEVWLAANSRQERWAIKLFKAKPNKRNVLYQRFVNEVERVRELTDVKGIVPVVDAHLPDRPKDGTAYLVMPQAVGLKQHLAGAPITDLVGAFAALSGTLAMLAARRISHRDLKPENLYWYDDGPALGDFGLVSAPGQEALTDNDRKLGPHWYIAPEMLDHPADSDGRAADVYSLAKTLWVLATGQTYPVPGMHLSGVRGHRITDYVEVRRGDLLDRLVEHCTAHHPHERPTMEEVHQNLKSWLDPEPPRSGPRPSLAEQARELRMLTEPVVDARAEHARLGEVLLAAAAAWASSAAGLAAWLHDDGFTEANRFTIGRDHFAAAALGVNMPRRKWLATAILTTNRSGPRSVTLNVLFTVSEQAGDPRSRLVAGIYISASPMSPPLEVVWRGEERSFVPSADAEAVMSSMTAELEAQIPHAVNRLIELARTTAD
ncbi:protein kinase domain-containing protein [Frankia tisae]|uniref:protein kinase domain-containing protein n=1 Tax=Frankia tisae TaxID=2950104 RepID=UPI0021C1E09E|nr:protein kinase [Frankia tisae]